MTRTTTKAAIVIVMLLIAAAGALAYLRDPPWLSTMETGFRGWETAPDGTRYRWTSGHASFFVPASALTIAIPARTTFLPGEPSVMVSIAIDDRPADEFVLHDDRWQVRRLRMPPPGSRRLRRVDIRVDRVREGIRGAQIGEVRVNAPDTKESSR
jgi:hypothetical protein